MSDPKHDAPKSSLSSGLYDKLKFIALVLLPAAGSVYFALAGIWNWPDAEQVVGSITVVDTALGGLLHVSSKNYQSNRVATDEPDYDGDLVAIDGDGEQALTLVLNREPAELANKGQVTFRVVQK